MIITEMVPVGKTRTKVWTDYGESFVLSNREILQYGICLGKELPDAVRQEIWENLFHSAIRKCGELLKNMDYTEKSLRAKLLQKGYPEEIVSRAVDSMKRAHYVDDVRYAQNYLQSHISGRSILKIRMELKARGISDEILENSFSKWEEENEIYAAEKEREQIRVLLRKRHYDAEQAGWQERQKVTAFLMRKGYSSERIHEVLHP